MSTMDLLQLAKICRSEGEAFHFLFQKRGDLYGVVCPGYSSSESIIMQQEDSVARRASGIIIRSLVHS